MDLPRHRPVRRLLTFWRLDCAAGCDWWPCPDSVPYEAPRPAVSLARLLADPASWTDPATAATPVVPLPPPHARNAGLW